MGGRKVGVNKKWWYKNKWDVKKKQGYKMGKKRSGGKKVKKMGVKNTRIPSIFGSLIEK